MAYQLTDLVDDFVRRLLDCDDEDEVHRALRDARHNLDLYDVDDDDRAWFWRELRGRYQAQAEPETSRRGMLKEAAAARALNDLMRASEQQAAQARKGK